MAKVAKKKSKAKARASRKRRTTEHVIADISFYHVGYRVTRCGYTFEDTRADYGYDASVFTFDDNGEVENGNIWVQLKATKALKLSATGSRIRFSADKRDLVYWQTEVFPVYLVIFDAKQRRAYWIYVQQYLQKHAIIATEIVGATLTLKIPVGNRVTLSAVRRWRRQKQRVIKALGSK